MPLTRDHDIAELLTSARTIAVVGASDRPDRPNSGLVFRRHGLSWMLSGVELPPDAP